MTETPPGTAQPDDTAQPDATAAAVGAVSLRLLAGAVSKKTMEQLRRTLAASPTEFPWQVVTQAILAEPVDSQRTVQQALVAQRDWIVRGGRETPRPSLSHRAKGLLARLCAQLIFGVLFAIVLVTVLLLLKYKTGFDIYVVLTWLQGLTGR